MDWEAVPTHCPSLSHFHSPSLSLPLSSSPLTAIYGVVVELVRGSLAAFSASCKLLPIPQRLVHSPTPGSTRIQREAFQQPGQGGRRALACIGRRGMRFQQASLHLLKVFQCMCVCYRKHVTVPSLAPYGERIKIFYMCSHGQISEYSLVPPSSRPTPWEVACIWVGPRLPPTRP